MISRESGLGKNGIGLLFPCPPGQAKTKMRVTRPAEAGGKRILVREKQERRRAVGGSGIGTFDSLKRQVNSRRAYRLFRSPGIYGSRVDTSGPYSRRYTVDVQFVSKAR